MGQYVAYIPHFVKRNPPTLTVSDFPAIETEVKNRLSSHSTTAGSPPKHMPKNETESTIFNVVYPSPVAALNAVLKSHHWYTPPNLYDDFYLVEISLDESFLKSIRFDDEHQWHYIPFSSFSSARLTDSIHVRTLQGPCCYPNGIPTLLYRDGYTSLPVITITEESLLTEETKSLDFPTAVLTEILKMENDNERRTSLIKVFKNKQLTLLEIGQLFQLSKTFLSLDDWKNIINTLLKQVIKSFNEQYRSNQDIGLHYLRTVISVINNEPLFTTYASNDHHVNNHIPPALKVFYQLTDPSFRDTFFDNLICIKFVLEPQKRPGISRSISSKALRPPNYLEELTEAIQKFDLTSFQNTLQTYLDKNALTLIDHLKRAVKNSDLNAIRKALYDIIIQEKALLEPVSDIVRINTLETSAERRKARAVEENTHILTSQIMTDCLSTAHQDSKSFLEAYFALESYIQTRPRETARESTHVIGNFHFFSAI
ncbi:MAG: hypothetical protein AB7F64_09055, partial [Gammaproteobacteria bacterium]